MPTTTTAPATTARSSMLRLRQEITNRHVRVGVLEPAGVDTESGSHNTAEVRERMIDPFYEQTEVLTPEDVADAVAYMVSPIPAMPPSPNSGSCPPTNPEHQGATAPIRHMMRNQWNTHVLGPRACKSAASPWEPWATGTVHERSRHLTSTVQHRSFDKPRYGHQLLGYRQHLQFRRFREDRRPRDQRTHPALNRLHRPLPDPPLRPRNTGRRNPGGTPRRRQGRQGPLPWRL